MNFTKLLYILFFLASLQLLTGCKLPRLRRSDELTKFESFQLSFRDPQNSKYFSFLFLKSDTIFLKKYSQSNSDSLFYSILTPSEKSNINIFVRQIDSLPTDSLEDLNSSEARFSLYFDYPNENHDIYLHSLNPPVSFAIFNTWVNKIKDSSNFNFVDTSIKFKEDEAIHNTIRKNFR